MYRLESEEEYQRVKKQVVQIEEERRKIRERLQNEGTEERLIKIAEWSCAVFYEDLKAQLRQYEREMKDGTTKNG